MIILTGGAGFIGTNMLIALNDKGTDDILVVDNISATHKWKNLVGRYFRQYVHKNFLWDWLDQNKIEKVEAVLHLGACTDTMACDFDYLAQNNILYSQKLWQICTERQIPFIYASSAATYGDGSFGFSDDHDETFQYRPINPYGYSKHLFDLWALKQYNTPPRWYGIKFFNVYGPYESHKERMASVAHFAIPQALGDGKIRLFKSYRKDCSDGDQKRDFVYVQDAVDIVLHLLNTSGPSGLYNAGTGKAQTFNHLADAIFKALEKPVKIQYVDMPDALQDSYQYFTKADMRKFISTPCDYQPKSLKEGIATYVNWYLENR
jgi:ADP-L-glycero-D-manno-heptose 6-epimerase